MIFNLICCLGLHWILKYGSILNIPRRMLIKIKIVDNLFKCSLCLGFWAGVIVCACTNTSMLLPFASAAICWFFDNLNNVLQSVELKLDE